MQILFIHQNFPGQYRYLAPAMQARGHRVVAIGARAPDQMPLASVDYHAYRVLRKNTPQIHPWLLDYETKIIRGEHCAALARQLASQGFKPDLICAHPGWGESLFLHDVWPNAKQLHYVEYFYNPEGQDVNFDPEFSSSTTEQRDRLWVKNTNNVMNFMHMTAGVTPTHWQRSTLPEDFRDRVSVIHDGIDTEVLAPKRNATVVVRNDRNESIRLTQNDEVVTFVNRNLEPFRGYHIFMRALARMMRDRPNAQFIVIGGDGVSYGSAPPKDTWKALFLKEVAPDIDLSRLHFLGRIPHRLYIACLQLSKAHIYLTYPFVLSWSLLEAMAIKAPIIASDTAPVRELIQDGVQGHLVDFFDHQALAEKVIDTLKRPDEQTAMRQRARKTIMENYDLRSKCLPAHIELIESLHKR